MLDRVVVSLFFRKKDAVRIAVSPLMVALFVGLLVTAPFVLGRRSATAKIIYKTIYVPAKVAVAPVVPVVPVAPAAPVVPQETKKEVVQETEKVVRHFATSGLKTSLDKNMAKMEFILLRKSRKESVSSGKIFAEVLDAQNATIGKSEVSFFRFSNARPTNFKIEIPEKSSPRSWKVSIQQSNGELETIFTKI